ncbi:nuclear pore glycoprotein p62 [Episyrphus balteatus]|uniref:nuclear pore glycoprotein p62 n=1 Tax=Episyrphus balteatus TaxID=286459 RepID=UPI002485D94E|nr:nuclear pore glycoprotein p62 [Episyrphus balteatus]
MNFGSQPTTTTPSLSFNLPTQTSQPSLTFGGSGGGDAGGIKPTLGLPATTIGGSFFSTPSSNAPTTSAPAPTLNFGSTAPSVAATAALTTSAAPALMSVPKTTSTGLTNLTTATKTTDSNAAQQSSTQITYNQLEEHINKWTLELEEQEKVFTDQATQINAWDKILISNNQKILELNDAVQKVKSDQQTLEQELEFIATQHAELEESIVPLQKEFMKIPQVDMERSQTYLLVENLDTQLKQMSEDLKEIIDNLNESNKGQDSTDPIIQIGKILNAHMSSLQWIESSSSAISNKLDDITKMHESFKRDSERSFRSAYYN